MAYSPIEQSYVDGVVSVEFPDPIIEEPQQEQPMMLADSGQVKSDAQAGFGTIGPIPRTKAQEALGYVGDLLTRAGVQLDKVGLDIPVLGRITLKDLTVGESGKVLEDMSYGFMPVEGAGGFISGTTRIKPDEALELLNLAPVVGAAAKVGGKAVVKGATKAVEATKGLPVGMSIKEVGQGVDELGFYSAAKQAVDSIQQPKGTGEQFLKQIEKTPGVKPEEIKWTGLDDFLKSKKTVTKQEVSEYLATNRVEVKEVQLRDPTPDDVRALMDDEAGQGMTYDEAFDYLKNDEGMTKFSKYTLPGGENYREVLLTLPSKTLDRNSPEMIEAATQAYGANALSRLSDAQWELVSNRVQSSPQFKSSHFDEPNILAHLRVNDRVDADGKKVLFVEEVQSDWHQAGRKKGYASAEKPYEVFDPKDGNVIATFKTEKEAKAYADELGPNVDYAKSEGVPNAPFKTTWHELAMKRAIQLAAEGGYDRVAFTTGKTQAERYDLSKEIDSIRWSHSPDGTYGINALRDTDSVISKNKLSIEQVEELVGKDIAKKVEIGAKDSFAGAIQGVDLQVGGEGMKGFYDNIVPKFLDKYAKKWDAKTGMTKIRVATDKQAAEDAQLLNELGVSKDGPNAMAQVHYIDITPKMKESVVTQGQPLFAIGAGGAGAAATQEENK